MNEQVGLQIKLVHDDDLEPEFIELGRDSEAKGLSRGSLSVSLMIRSSTQRTWGSRRLL